MTEQPEILSRLHRRQGRLSEAFILTEDDLIEEGRRGARHWRRNWPLRQLEPQVEYRSDRPEGAKQSVLMGAVLIAVAVSFYFSDFNSRIPLLAPLLVLLGALALGRGLKNWRVETWTIFRRLDGSMATHCLHRGTGAGERLEFERMFTERVRLVQRSQSD
jgi:hypothetical protein